MGGVALNRPVTGMVRSGSGYLMLARSALGGPVGVGGGRGLCSYPPFRWSRNCRRASLKADGFW